MPKIPTEKALRRVMKSGTYYQRDKLLETPPPNPRPARCDYCYVCSTGRETAHAANAQERSNRRRCSVRSSPWQRAPRGEVSADPAVPTADASLPSSRQSGCCRGPSQIHSHPPARRLPCTHFITRLLFPCSREETYRALLWLCYRFTRPRRKAHTQFPSDINPSLTALSESRRDAREIPTSEEAFTAESRSSVSASERNICHTRVPTTLLSSLL
ncbi:hypothetical protein SKAU_G00334280 [Synaphobranchus kaupii]|uniref:Uncharacterized protein n=1 Tax=Synaphobranchus kaupii TaxID=118154 RepID=A0A9Q1ELW9_SYNKA|nr:hypothetical protein SKAU_G00334280 [Synaphobranchus kaupii]